MATEPPYRVVEQLSAPQHYLPPSARELRAHAVQRLQAGLFGLSGIVLVVGLANIINDRARLTGEAARTAAVAAPSAATSGSDPLADIGVVPSSVPAGPAVDAAGAPAATSRTPAARGQAALPGTRPAP